MPNIVIHISGSEWDDFKVKFLLDHPNLSQDAGSPMSDDEWIHFCVRRYAQLSYERGFAIEAQNNVCSGINSNMVTRQWL